MANPVNGEWAGSSYEAAFEQLLPEVFGCPDGPDGIPVRQLPSINSSAEPSFSGEFSPYAAMYAAYAMGQTT